jgi:hypothetical protein
MGRRYLMPAQKSDLRGQRHNREKRQGERTDLTSPHNEEKPTTAQRLAERYQVSVPTIERDGDFAEAVDTLEQEVRRDLRQAELKCKSHEEKARTTKGE